MIWFWFCLHYLITVKTELRLIPVRLEISCRVRKGLPSSVSEPNLSHTMKDFISLVI